jgi:hypothetical protein
MDSGGVLALAILVVTLAFTAMYFAFKEVPGVQTPSEALQWLRTEINGGSSVPNAPAPSNPNATEVLPTPTGQPDINSQLTGQ